MTPVVSTTARPSIPPQIFSTPASVSTYADFVSQPVLQPTYFSLQDFPHLDSTVPISSKSDSTVLPVEEALPKRKRGRPRLITTNLLKPYLRRYLQPKQLLRLVPQFDNFLCGVAQLDLGGNTRPLSTEVLLNLLCKLDEITSEGVIKWTGYSKGHATKVARCLRLAVSFGIRTVESWPKVDEEGYIVTKIVCNLYTLKNN